MKLVNIKIIAIVLLLVLTISCQGKDDTEDDKVKSDQRKIEEEEDSDDSSEDDIEIFIRNADPQQPLLQYVDNAMDKKSFIELQSCLHDHPMRHHNVNADDTFAGTTGFLVSFNEKGIDKFKNHDSFLCLYEYFKKFRLPNANGWVMNMVWAQIPNYEKEFAIELHTDDALLMDFDGEYKVMPIQTNVLYVFVPKDMIGGNLEAWDFEATNKDIKKGPPASVTPVENRMAFFRGDAQHQVRSYNTSSEQVLRGSLVLEQYNIPKQFKDMVRPFIWKDRYGGEMM